jgi:D-glycero-alpha-D-manno-heptose-7-phosphate kinase
MIISKTPYRIPLSGGGTDLDFYYRKKEGELYSLAINQYVYVYLHSRKIDTNFLIQTTNTQFAGSIDKIKHQLIRETLKAFNLKEKLHIATYTTVPTNTGLGSSSAMVIGLIKCICRFKKIKLNNIQIIKKAFMIERKICNQYGGWQDQVISQMGGIIKLNISKKEKINISKVKSNPLIEKNIKNRFLLVYTRIKRYSSEVALSQKKRKNEIIDLYDKIKSLNKTIIFSLKNKNPAHIANLLNEHWKIKKKLSNKITDKKIDQFFNMLLKKYKFLGGKLIGAGGGGFFLMVTNNKLKTIKILQKNNIGYIDFMIDNVGSRIIEDQLNK